jgi:hypothetical protein
MEGVAIVESDVNKEVMVVWSYPGVTGTPLEAAMAAQAEVFCGHAAVEAAAQPGRKPSAAYFSKHGGTWMYGCVERATCALVSPPLDPVD